jgi:hypothetical protein
MQRTAAAVLGVSVLAASLLAAEAMPAATAEAASTGVTVTVVGGPLNAPKHLTLTQAGLFVTESGAGGTAKANCVMGPATGGTNLVQYCAGLTGAVSLIRGHGVPLSVWLPSVIEEDTQEVAGPAAVASNGDSQAVVFQDVLETKDGGNALPKPLGTPFGELLVRQGGTVVRADLAAFAAAHPQPASSLGDFPGETAYNSDPYDVAAYRGGYVVADAGANDLLEVSEQGKISLLARFPTLAEQAPANLIGNPKPITIEAQAVPTAVAVGPDGALYVSLLRGVPSDPGTAYVYRVVPGHRPTIWARGLTAVTAIAFDSKGRLLATEYNIHGLLAPATVPGALVRISRNGHTVTKLPVPGLYQPTGVAAGPGGVVYVSNYGGNVATDSHPGQLLKITGLP